MCLCALHTYSYHIYIYNIITYKYIQYNIINHYGYKCLDYAKFHKKHDVFRKTLCFQKNTMFLIRYLVNTMFPQSICNFVGFPIQWYRSLFLIPLIHVCRWGSSDPRRWWNKHPMFLRILGQLATFNIHFCWFCAGLFLENPAKEITSRTVSWVWIRRLMPTPLHSTIGIAATTPIHICANQMIATQPPPLKQKSPWPQFLAQESFYLVYWDCCKTNVHIATLVPKKVATSPYVAESHRRRKVPLRSAQWDQRLEDPPRFDDRWPSHSDQRFVDFLSFLR